MQKLSVVVLSYNHPLHTARAVRSALQWNLPVLLVHNGSLSKHVELLKKEFQETSQFTHLVLPENKGYSGGVNEGLYAATSEWVIFLTNDCELLSVPKLPLKPMAVIPQVFRRSLNQIDSIGGLFEPTSGKLVHCKTKEDFENPDAKWSPYIPGSSFLVHREVFEKTKGMDESLGTYWDDVDWSLRIQKMNFPIQLQEQWHVLHYVGKTCQKNPLYSIYYFQRNRKKISWKYTKPSEKPKLCFALAKDWTRLSLNLISKKRYSDLRLIKRALFE
ncbi:MAG: glycosyltransferase family 2 protein [Bdellovibrionales bacterium]